MKPVTFTINWIDKVTRSAINNQDMVKKKAVLKTKNILKKTNETNA
jgi:hypothetical protein